MGKKRGKRSKSRRICLKSGFVLAVAMTVWGVAGEWFVHHPRAWIDKQPKLFAAALLWIGNPLADITDALNLTGYDTVAEYDTEAPAGEVAFAGLPRRVGEPAPADLRVLDRGDFKIGWSDTLRRPVWCAYHVLKDARYELKDRPSFSKDREVPSAPAPDAYARSGYDRGHLAPNWAISTRYGREAQKLTFRMTNVAPQAPALNRQAWRDVEHRIADLWTARYGEIWVVVGCLPANRFTPETIAGSHITIPEGFYQIIIAQEGMDVRMLAVLFPQTVGWHEWPARYLVTVDEIERLTGLDFNPDLPSFIQDQLEADLPNRLWPIRIRDIFELVRLRFD